MAGSNRSSCSASLRRGVCLSRGARHMIETSTYPVDHVFPDVPIRQWVLSLRQDLRLLFASQPYAVRRGWIRMLLTWASCSFQQHGQRQRTHRVDIGSHAGTGPVFRLQQLRESSPYSRNSTAITRQETVMIAVQRSVIGPPPETSSVREVTGAWKTYPLSR